VKPRKNSRPPLRNEEYENQGATIYKKNPR